MINPTIMPSLRIEEQMRDLIDKTIQRFGQLNGAVSNTIAERRTHLVTGQDADSNDLSSQSLCSVR